MTRSLKGIPAIRPACAGWLREGAIERRRTIIKKKPFMQPTNTKTKIQGLLSRTALSSGKAKEPAKYIIVIWDGREQVISFPRHVEHAAILNYIQQENPQVQAVSAGFFLAEGKAFWLVMRSESLDLDPRPQDAELIKSFLTSPDRSEWDLTLMTPGGAK